MGTVGRSFTEFGLEDLAALRELPRHGDESSGLAQLQGDERIDDYARGKRMLQLLRDGMRKYPAAHQACIEDLGGASEDACRRRLVRKYSAGKFQER
jgi:hypothetical protein